MIQIGINISVKGAGVSGPPPAPVNTVLPVISGTTTIGSVLTTTNGTWINSPSSFTYQWKRNATNIGTNANTYTLVNADAGQSITCVVTATNGGGSTPATSNAVQIQNFFTTTWTTTANSEQITLPYNGGTYTGTIDWGDGNTDINDGTVTAHTYATAGTYTVIITGDCIGWNVGDTTGSSTHWTSVVNWGQLQLGADNGSYFYGCNNLDLSSVSDTLDLTGVTNLNGLFLECFALTTINNINSWDTSAVTSMNSMFADCFSFNQALTFNTSAVTSMNSMFTNCLLFNQALTFNTSAVTSMNSMFTNCPSFNQPLSFDTSAVTNMSVMFNGCSVFNQPLTFNTSAVTSMDGMFGNCSVFNSLLTFDTSSVTDMNSMFRACSVFNQPLTFDTSSVEFMNRMFRDATAFNQNISSWNTGAVTDMNQMFRGATAFNQNIGTWNVENVTNFSGFMQGKTDATFSTTNLDAIYNGWSTQAVQQFLNITFGTAKYTGAGVAGRLVLTGTKLWTITDGGL